MAELLSVDLALEQILKKINPLAAETADTLEALGRVLANDIVAETDVPPFANSSMDGFAVHAQDIQAATQDKPVSLQVTMDIPAGTSPDKVLRPGEAARIMTGAPMPEGADSVIPVEDTDAKWTPGDSSALPQQVTIFRGVKTGDYVRPIGEDIRIGQQIMSAGTVLRAEEIAVLAVLGRPRVFVIRQPRVAILSTGDELIEIDAPPQKGKIRDSNSYALAALVTTYGGIPLRIPIARDTIDDVRRRFREALDQKPDIILSSAGVSVGAFDVVRAVIDDLGAVDFWRINLRPGKPLAFGHVGGVPFFGLPGNPVSAMVTFDIFVRPTLLKLGGRPEDTQMTSAILGEDLCSDGRRSYLRVKLSRENGHLVARLTGTQSSGALTSMVAADGLLIVPENVTQASAGTEFSVRLLRDIQ